MMAELGSRVQDVVSGFSGIVTGRVEYLNGCVRVLIEPEKLKDSGERFESEWFDEGQVEVVEEETKVVKKLKGMVDRLMYAVGGPQKNPTVRQAPKW